MGEIINVISFGFLFSAPIHWKRSIQRILRLLKPEIIFDCARPDLSLGLKQKVAHFRDPEWE